MEPGTGKTRAAYELIKSVPGIDYVLYLAPYQTINRENYEETVCAEIEKCGGFDVDHDFIGIESLSNSNRIFLEIYSKLEKASKPFIVCDESLKIKNWTAKRTKRIVELGLLAEFKLILNGTPISRNLLDMWAQMEFLSPRILNMGIAEYKNTFCEYTRITKRIGNRRFTREFITKYHNVDYLYARIKHYVYEADLELDVKKQYISLNYSVDEETRKQYEYLKEKYLDNENLQFIRQNIFLELTQKMQHLYCDTEEKFSLLRELIRNNPAEKICVFTKFIRSRETIKEKFPTITVLSYGKETFGLNLQDYNRTVFWDKTWDYAKRLQAERRTYRTGQEDDCLYFDFTGDVGLESMIDRNVNNKFDLAEYLKKVSVKQLKEQL
ncbi:SNF2-related protein [Draconibacterium orientale]|uniref:SNF2-related protein n=1 Tax=Draconibacterium orientale TaxID=1168034 RepID=UPI0029C0C27C|nr:SNF2-related protein [Draconibacterium orientale]